MLSQEKILLAKPMFELLSPSAVTFDKTEKLRLYQDRIRVPEYFWFDPFAPDDWAGIALDDGQSRSLIPQPDSNLISRRLGLKLVRRQRAIARL